MPGSAIDPLFVRANLVEAALWAAMAVVVLVRWRRPAGIVLAGALLAFGLSDVVETRTGAWYRPWWLLAWKGVALLAIVTCGVRVARSSRAPRAG